MSRRFLATPWTVGRTADPAQAPTERVPAQVPGAVQLDWARHQQWPPYWHGEHYRDYQGLEDQYWVYRTPIPTEPLADGERLFFVCGGVDYQWEVRIAGRVVHAQEGMFTPLAVDCTAHAATGAELEVVVFPAPKRHPAPADRSQASASVKPAVSYGWDWHPRLIPLGIWQETGFEVRPAAHLDEAELSYELAEDGAAAALRIAVVASAAAVGREARWSLAGPDGVDALKGVISLSASAAEATARLEHPRLWWPHHYGEPALYRLTVELVDAAGAVLDRRVRRIGFRRVRLVMHPAAWQEPAGFPKSRSEPPCTIEINGRTLFAKGTNWVNPEIFPGLCTAETYRPLLQLARDAHFDLLRCWGGAPVPKEAFFDLCDELGLLVWQEFPLACNLYPDDAAYLAVLDQESSAIIRRVRRHPSLAIWGGGNELFNAWSGMTDQALPLRLLNRNCYNLDPVTPFIATAPLGGMGHGDYRFRDAEGREVFQIYRQAQATAYSEFGCPGPSPVDYLRRFLPPDEVWPPQPGGAWEAHHAFGAWLPDTWLALDVQRHYFGEPASLEELVARGEWLQAAGYQCIFEEARRQKPRCAMALNWCFNEPWPTAANNSIVNWPARPKPAYHAVAAACRPVLASARLPKFSWQSGELFRAELWLLNDTFEALGPGRVQAVLVTPLQRTLLLTWEYPGAAANTNVPGPEVRCALPDLESEGVFTLELVVTDRPEWSSAYRLHVSRGRCRSAADTAATGAARPLNL